MKRIRSFLMYLTRSPIGLVGTILAGTSGLLIVTLTLWEYVGEEQHPYLGIITYMVLPVFLILGLILIVVGIRRQRRRFAARLESGEIKIAEFPVIDLNDDRTRAWMISAGAFGATAAVILTMATAKGVEFVDSTAFCGETCHVMEPEFTAYQRSPHAKVHCVECHVGSGARFFLKAKVSGVRQVYRLWTNTYDRPIPTPVQDLRPASATCEHCHWPTKFIGDRTAVNDKFRSDSANTHLQTILQVHVGGATMGESAGIHWHVDPANQVTYRSDPSREDIREVVLTRPDGTEKRWFNSADPDPRWNANETPSSVESADGGGPIPTDIWRTMDCADCHNRPTHVYWTPEQAMDQALLRGVVSQDLPFVRREGLRLLQEEYGSRDEALGEIAAGIEAFYRENYPDVADAQAEAVTEAGDVIGVLWATNVFPAMNVTWGTYPDHLGHPGFKGGCLRCHTSTMKTEDGESVSTDCGNCHQVLAMDRPAAQIRLTTEETAETD
jgi:nitrate/TMAO reductase-like tetraheme cytochrome c subunit